MEKLTVNLEHCFGIKKMEKEFNFDKNRTILLYAPNGTMKTSFAKTLQNMSQVKDLLHPNEQSNVRILSDGIPLDQNCIFVADAEKNIDSSESVTNILACKELKEKYDAIYRVIDKQKKDFIKVLKDKSSSSDCEEELYGAFRENEEESFLLCFKRIYSLLSNKYQNFDFKYNDVFDKKGEVLNFLKLNKELLNEYFKQYQKLISESTLFCSKDGAIFGTYEATILENTLKDGTFFDVDHKIVLNNGEEIKDIEELSNKIQKEKDRISSDEKIKKAFDRITVAIDKNINLRAFKSVIERTPSLLSHLTDYEKFKKEVWLGFLSDENVKNEAKKLYDLYSANEAESQKIIEEASKQQDKWKEIISLYNVRFHVPFLLEISNQKDMILKQKIAKIKFIYKDNEEKVEKKKEELEAMLSRGEKRALYILQLLFEIEARKNNEKETLLVFDDIADSFDYQNKYAIIEYIADLQNNEKFRIILLTHNFDFYRNVCSRLELNRKSSIFMCVKKKDGTVEIKEGEYLKNLCSCFISNINDDKKFISLIPFVRNLMEYTTGTDSREYEMMTNCLHIKEKNPTEAEILCIINKVIRIKNFNRIKKETAVRDLIFKTADSILKKEDVDQIDIENKIVLSIAIRLKTEFFLKNVLQKLNIDIKEDSNQTRCWIQKYKEDKKHKKNEKNDEILEEVNMLTPEFIHVNSFMYEPLIDTGTDSLLDLYKRTAELQID